MGLTVSHSLSATTPNDPTFEIRPEHWNSNHIYSLNAAGSEISGAFGNGGGVSFGLSADGKVTAAAPAGAPSPINFSAGTTSSNIGSVVFSNSGGISFGLNGSTITGTVATNYQSQGAYLTTAALSQDSSKYAGTNGAITGGSITVNTSGVSVNLPAYLTTADLSANSSKYIQNWKLTGNTSGTTSSAQGTDFWLAGGNGVTISGSSNTLSFSVATNYQSQAAYLTTARASNDAIGLNTAQSNVTWTVNSSGLSLDARGYAGTGTSATNASITLNSVGLAISVAAPGAGGGVAAGISNTGNTAGNTGTVSSGTLVFAASGGITASESTAAGQSTLWFSVAAPVAQTNQTVGLYALGNTTQNSSTTLDARTMSFNGLGAATWGYSNGSIQVSVPATSSIVGTSGLSVSTAGSTISVLPVALSAWDPYPIISGTAVSSHAPASFWFSRMILDWDVAVSYANVLKSLNVSAPGMSSQNSSATNKFSYSHGLTLFTRQNFGANSSNMSQWTTASFGMTGSLSQSSSSASVALSWVTNSTGGTTSFSTTSGSNLWTNFFTGMQMFRIPLVTTLTPGEYFIGQAHSSTTATVGSNFTLLSVSNLHVAPASNTFATITSSGSLAFSSPDGLGLGVASAVTTNNTMAMSVISAGTQNWWYMNFSNI